MIKDKFGEQLERAIHLGLPILFKRRIDPNLLSLAGAVVCCAAAVAFGAGEFVIGSLLLGLGGLCDLVDGIVARHFDVATQFGAFLDSTLDRLVDIVVFLALVIYYMRIESPTPAGLAAVGLVASVLTSYTKARAESMGISLPGGFIERGERIFLIVLGGLVGLMEPALWVLAVGSTATVAQRFESARRALGREASQDKPEGTRDQSGEWVHGE